MTTIQDDDNDESDGGKAPKIKRTHGVRRADALDTPESPMSPGIDTDPAESPAEEKEQEEEGKTYVEKLVEGPKRKIKRKSKAKRPSSKPAAVSRPAEHIRLEDDDDNNLVL